MRNVWKWLRSLFGRRQPAPAGVGWQQITAYLDSVGDPYRVATAWSPIRRYLNSLEVLRRHRLALLDVPPNHQRPHGVTRGSA